MARLDTLRPSLRGADAGGRRLRRSASSIGSARRWTTISTRPAAVATLFDAVRRANADGDLGAAAAALEIADALGLVLGAGGGDVPADVLARAAARDDARAGKDWAAADRIRDELVAAGWVVEDTADGTVVRPG